MKKQQLGQYFTKEEKWLLPHIKEILNSTNKTILFDPFAWEWDLLKIQDKFNFKSIYGLDIDKSLWWDINDSLLFIPKIEDSFLITNPPYLSKNSARKKSLYKEEYFSKYDDLYKLALEKIFENNEEGLVIIPETFINSKFDKKYIISITILEENPFLDTEVPVCIIYFNKKSFKNIKEIKMYKNDIFIDTLWNLEKFKIKKNKNNIVLKFNDKNWQIALKAIDWVKKGDKIRFLEVKDLNYNINNIKVSSRAITIISIPEEYTNIKDIIEKCNILLNNYRKKTNDIFLSPFKGNNKEWNRRRRLDYKTWRIILENILNYN